MPARCGWCIAHPCTAAFGLAPSNQMRYHQNKWVLLACTVVAAYMLLTVPTSFSQRSYSPLRLEKATNVRFKECLGKLWLMWDVKGKKIALFWPQVHGYYQDSAEEGANNIFIGGHIMRSRITNQQIDTAWNIYQYSKKGKDE